MPAITGIYPDPRVLRSRTRTGETTEWGSPVLNRQFDEGDPFLLERRIFQIPRFRTRSIKVKLFFILALVLVVLCGYMRFLRSGGTGRVAYAGPPNERKGNNRKQMKANNIGGRPIASKGLLETAPKRSWRYPLVDRTMLEKLDRMEQFYSEDYGLSPKEVYPNFHFRWPPIVTRIPERINRPYVGGSNTFKLDESNDICESKNHPHPCRFLLPLRISEQESKARMHFLQIAQLARDLNRTLVLPNVGKSKIGTCFKWTFATYYDPASLPKNEVDSAETFVDLESFRVWANNRDRKRREPLKSQFVSIAPALPPGSALKEEPIYTNDDVAVHGYNRFGAWERDLPGCFSSRFEQLKLETRPIFMLANSQVKRDGEMLPIANSIVDAFSATSQGPLHETPVMVVSWDLRYPVYKPSPHDQPLQYSPRMHDLASKYAPKDPYLVVQWRMETVNLEFLAECAHAMVDVLGRVLHDTVLAENVTTVWFASDYPYPIASRGSSRPQVIAAKSGTFKDFEIRHEEAIEILRKAFSKQGDLKKWRLTDFSESMEGHSDAKSQNELLQDPGVLGILDKIASIQADLFVSGSTRCSRKSSFTKQVVDARNERWGKDRNFHLKNVVDIFG